jgi:hypothetical protein
MAKVSVTGPDSLENLGAEFRQTTVSVAGDKVALDVATSATPLATVVDEASATVTYVGKAAIGSSQASAVWQIAKITESGTTVTTVTWADGNSSFDNVWTARAGLSYS